MKNLEQMAEVELLRTYTGVIDELMRRGVVRTRNAPIGDYTEWLVCSHLGLEMQANSKAAFDASDANGIHYQIKGRRSEKQSDQFSVIRNLEENGFHFLIAIVFNNDWSIRLAVKIPHEVVARRAAYSGYVNGHILTFTDKIIAEPGVIDIRHRFV